jgi:purine-nucleoside phosphorylase
MSGPTPIASQGRDALLPEVRGDFADAVEAAAEAVRRRWSVPPRVGLILGTGLGDVAEHIAADVMIPYHEIPHFPPPTALSHRGQLVCGWLAHTPVVALEGRWHGYEGHDLAALMLPVYVLRALGSQWLVLSNASGGLNPRYAPGDVMIVADHINLMFWRSLPDVCRLPDGGRASRATGTRPPYDAELIARALGIARRENFAAHQGVYVGVTGPNYETRAEYRFLRRIGGDAVGMSTVPEAVAAARCGLRTLALSVITNVACPDRPRITQALDVVELAQRAEPKVRAIVRGIIESAGT